MKLFVNTCLQNNSDFLTYTDTILVSESFLFDNNVAFFVISAHHLHHFSH
ncbi:MAG TPA: hypothetical protein VLB80_01740 [Candidatus Babeliales bacterium]|nr:hypothetical protein [Candidatus Babeliales bacterium]